MRCANYGCVRPMIIIKFQPKASILTGSNNPFSIKPAAARLKISGKKHQFFQFEVSLPQAIKQKETYFGTRKILQNFDVHDHWDCRHFTF